MTHIQIRPQPGAAMESVPCTDSLAAETRDTPPFALKYKTRGKAGV
jgi:hypothetical protein